MRLNAKGQVTIPADLRARYGLREGDEVDVVADGESLRIVANPSSPSYGQRVVQRMTGTATTQLSTDDLMALLRG